MANKRRWAIACLAISLAAAAALGCYRQWMAWVYPSADMASGSVYWLLFPLMLLPLLAAAFLTARWQAAGRGPLCLVSAIVLLTGAVALVPALRHHDAGSLAQTIEKRVSPQAAIKSAGIFYRSGDYRLNERQLEQLRSLCQSARASTCLPLSAIRSEPVSDAGKPRLWMTMDNPADRSQTYDVDIVFYSENLAYLGFYQTSGPNVYLLYAIEADGIYRLIQENLANLQYP